MAQRSHRAEDRAAVKVLVELSSFENATYEMTYTISVSRRGACIMSKDVWTQGQRLSVRSIEGDVNSSAQIAYCNPKEDGTYVVGVVLDRPAQNWGSPFTPSR
jgi:hypothetical protein